MKSPYWLGILCLFVPLQALLGQTQTPQLPSVIPPSPTVANLMHFEEVPVDHYSGQPDISVPLMSKQLDSELTLPLVLKYHTMGVRIDERSGWVGTGWSLDAGGTVSRTVRGIADEHQKGDGGYEDKTTGIFHLDDFWDFPVTGALTLEEKREFAWNVVGTSDDKFDSEPDLYQFSMLGMSGRFIIVKEGGQFVAKSLTQDQKYKIDITFNPTTHAPVTFKITDANGYEYHFGLFSDTTESTETTTTVYTDNRGGVPNAPVTEEPVTSITAWHLKYIKNSNSKILATFTYDDSEESYSTSPSVTIYDFEYPIFWYDKLFGYNLSSVFKPDRVTIETDIVTQTQKLSRIAFEDGSAFSFKHGSSHPEHGGVILDKIFYVQKRNNVTDANDEIIRTFDLNYITVISSGRLFLSDVTAELGIKHEFEYYSKELLAGFGGHHDQWGYSRADHRSDGNYSFNYYDFNAHKYGLLKRIKYPTGGAKQFNWEPNTFSYEGDELIYDYDSNPNNSVTGDLTYEFNSSTVGTHEDEGSLNITHDQYIKIDANFTSGSGNASKFFIVFSKTGKPDKHVELNNIPDRYLLPKGYNSVKVVVEINQTTAPADAVSVAGYLNIDYVTLKEYPYYQYNLIGGGPRIGSIQFVEIEGATETIKKTTSYSYSEVRDDLDLWLNQPVTISSGAVDAKLGNFYKNYILSEHRYYFAMDDCYPNQVFEDNIAYDVKTWEPIVHLTKGNYVGYRTVKQYDGGQHIQSPHTEIETDNGYTEYTFSNTTHWPSPDQSFHYPFHAPPNLDFKRGLLLGKKVFDKDFNLVQEEINNYEYAEDAVGFSMAFYDGGCEWKPFYDTYDHYMTNDVDYSMDCNYGITWGSCFSPYSHCTDADPVLWHVTTLTAGRAKLMETIKKEYFTIGTSVSQTESRVTYDYNNINYQLKEQISYVSEGGVENQYKTTYEYPVTYTASLFTTAERNLIDNTVVVRNMINKPLVIATFMNNQPLQKIINKYGTFSYDPDNNAGNGILHSNLIHIKEIETLKHNASTGEDRIIYHAYDHFGHPLDVSQAEGMRTSYIWGYDETLPVAKIDNVTYQNLLTNNLTILNNIKNYSKNSTYNAASLNSAITALRDYYVNTTTNRRPITTLKHHPAKGVEEVTDAQGKVLKYEYDALTRLKCIRDKDNKIISENKYNYRTTNSD